MVVRDTSQEQIFTNFAPVSQHESKDVSMTCLVRIVQNHVELGALIESWFLESCGLLSAQERTAIRELLGQKD
jgi:hypothetical protein